MHTTNNQLERKSTHPPLSDKHKSNNYKRLEYSERVTDYKGRIKPLNRTLTKEIIRINFGNGETMTLPANNYDVKIKFEDFGSKKTLTIVAQNLNNGDCRIVTRSFYSPDYQNNQNFSTPHSSSENNRKSQFSFKNQTQYNSPQAYLKPAQRKRKTFHFNSFENPLPHQSGEKLSDKIIFITGAFFTTEDIYNNFGHNHTTYRTTKGVTKNIYKSNNAVRSARAAKFARASTAVKWVGNAGSVFVIAIAIRNISNDLENGNDVSGWDIADGSAGVIGLASTSLAAYGIISNPVGWAIGACTAFYGWLRLWFDLGTQYGPSTWYGSNDYKWFE